MDAQHQEFNAQTELMGALSALHIGGKYSDLTILCNYKQWAVHKAIVCSRSAFFDATCSHQFREARSGVIDLSEDDEFAVEHMIHYLYHLDYLNDQPEQQPSAMFRHRAYSGAHRKTAKKLDFSGIEDPLLAQAGFYAPPVSPTSSQHSHDEQKSRLAKHRSHTPPLETSVDHNCESASDDGTIDESTEGESHLLLHARVYALAEKYDIPTLKQLARRKFEIAMACYYDSPEFVDAIEEVYCSTIDSDRGLRDVVLQAFRTHPQLASTRDVHAVIEATPSLVLDLFKMERGVPI